MEKVRKILGLDGTAGTISMHSEIVTHGSTARRGIIENRSIRERRPSLLGEHATSLFLNKVQNDELFW